MRLTRSLNLISEMAAPNEAMRAVPYYHGTDKTGSAMMIVQQGLKGAEIQGRANQSPLKDKVYLTDDLHYAVIYALGGVLMGHDMTRDDVATEPYGYVFVVDGKSIGDVQPDEDSVGEAVSYAFRAMKGQTDLSWATGFPMRIPRAVIADKNVASLLSTIATRVCNAKILNRAVDGEASYQSRIGKQMVGHLPDWLKIWLLQNGAHVAHHGPIMPSGCWRIDKRRSKEIAKDASNFFNIAEKWWGQS